MVCKACNGTGTFVVDHCPRDFIGSKIARTANAVMMANKGHLPNAGGMLDQDAWFVSAYNALESDCNKIDAEDRKQ